MSELVYESGALAHYAKGTSAKKHKYLYIDANGNYVYKEPPKSDDITSREESSKMLEQYSKGKRIGHVDHAKIIHRSAVKQQKEAEDLKRQQQSAIAKDQRDAENSREWADTKEAASKFLTEVADGYRDKYPADGGLHEQYEKDNRNEAREDAKAYEEQKRRHQSALAAAQRKVGRKFISQYK